MKKIIKVTIFMFIFIVLLLGVFYVFRIERNPITEFYNEPKNSLDVVYIGGSNAYMHFNTTLAYHMYGFTTGMLSFDSQPFLATEYLIKESEKYQNPNLYVIDISKVEESYTELEEGAIRKVTDSMKNSKNRTELIDKILSYNNISKEEQINYYFSFMSYHDIWKSPVSIIYNLFGNKLLYKGYLLTDKNVKKYPLENFTWSDNIMPLDKENKEVLQSLIKYIKSKNLNVLFVVSKRPYENEQIYKINDSIKIIEDNGYEVLNFNTLSSINFDIKNDFLDDQHLNVWGATKYTLYFSKYISENYKLPNYKDDKKYKSWSKEYERFKDSFNKLTGENFDELLAEYKNEGY